MAKLSKKVLKGIVKECLVELLAEGLSGGDVSSLNESISSNSSTNNNSNKNIRRMLPPKSKKKNQSFEKNVDKVVKNATNDPVMASILTDTAKTTLQEQNQNDQPGKFTTNHRDRISQAVAESDPSELFGSASSNWANLAFSNK
tara:strand:- start:425 stop:856 length:432 start_codon:yes stop_codon:yes gene_type:complete